MEYILKQTQTGCISHVLYYHYHYLASLVESTTLQDQSDGSVNVWKAGYWPSPQSP